MADGDVINKLIKDFLKGASATSRASRKKASEIVAAVLAKVPSTANVPRVKLAVLALLETYTSMVALGRPSAIQTADDVSGFWLDLNNINANADTDFSCGLSGTPAVAATESVATAPTVSARSRSGVARVRPTRSANGDCCELLMAAIKLHDANVIADSAFIEMVKNIAHEQVVD